MKQASYEIVQSIPLVNQGLNSGQSICSHGNWATVDDGNGRCKKCSNRKDQHRIGFEYEEYEDMFDTSINSEVKDRYDKCVLILE